MEKHINPVPEIIADEPDAHHGNFLDGFVADRQFIGKTFVYSNSEDFLERNRDNLRSRVFDETTSTSLKTSQ